MAILRTEDGKTLSTHTEINELIQPTQIGTFRLPANTHDLLKSITLPLTRADAERILATFDPELDQTLCTEGFVHRRVGCLARGNAADPRNKSVVGLYTQPGPSGIMPAEALTKYSTPHRLGADDRHHVYAGMIVKGLILPDGKQVMLYVGPGEWIRLHKTTVNWPVFPYDGPNIAVSYFDRKPQTEDGNYNMNLETNLSARISA